MSGRYDERSDETERKEHDEAEVSCHECVDQATRETVLERDRYRCQACGRRAPSAGGLAELHVHHIERNPDGMGEHDLDNLTTLCRPCHSWLHQQRSPEDAPVSLTEEDLTRLLPQDIDILRYLAEEGPARTGDVKEALPIDLSVMAVRERLWVLMGLDNCVEPRDRQIVDQDVETGEWGLVEQIETSARGHIPTDSQQLVQRLEDEQVRQALERGCARDTIAAVFGIARRTSFYKEKRAYAYDFPLEAFRRGGRAIESESVASSQTVTAASTEQTEHQQRLDTLAEEDYQEAEADVNTVSSSDCGDSPVQEEADRAPNVEHAASGSQEEEEDPIQRAIRVLQAVENQP